MTEYSIGEHPIGLGAAPLFLPDIGTFFNKDAEVAEQLLCALADAGITVVKGEILHDPELCLDDETAERYADRDGGVVTERYRDLIERKVVSLETYAQLFERCKQLGMEFVLSVYDLAGADFGKDIGAIGLKIASSNIVHQPLIEHVARMSLPMIVDTGHATVEEISRCINWAIDAGAQTIVVEHSPAAPPNPLKLHNLRFMCTLGATFGLPFGLSDHHAGDEMLYAAVAMGASVLEKGVCPDWLQTEQDVGHALPVSRVRGVVAKCNNIYEALGDGVRNLPRDRQKYVSRMGLVAKRDLAEGDRISPDTVTFAWPAKGIPVEHWGEVIGWRVRTSVDRGRVIAWSDVEPLAS